MLWRNHGANDPRINEHPAGGRLPGNQLEKNLCAGQGPEDSLHPGDRQMDVSAETDRRVDRTKRRPAGAKRDRAGAAPISARRGKRRSEPRRFGDLFEQRTKPASFFLNTVGSSAGLTALRNGVADLATAHLLDPASGEYNLPFVKNLLGDKRWSCSFFTGSWSRRGAGKSNEVARDQRSGAS